MAQNPVPTAARGEGVVLPTIQHLTIHAARRVVIPQWHTKTTLESYPEKGRRNVGVDARRISGEPGPSTRNATRLKMQTAMSWEGWGPQSYRTRTEPRSSRTRISGMGIHYQRTRWPQRGWLCARPPQPPQGGNLRQGQMGRTPARVGCTIPDRWKSLRRKRRELFSSAPGSEPACGDAERSQAPVISRQGTTNELAHGRTEVAVRCPESVQLGIRGYGATGVEDLGPPRARPQKAECLVCVWEPANGGPEGPGLGDAATQKILTPLLGPDRSTQKLELGSTVPGAPLEVTRAEGLDGGASRDDFRLTHVDCEPDAAEVSRESGEEAADGWGGTSTKTVIEQIRSRYRCPPGARSPSLRGPPRWPDELPGRKGLGRGDPLVVPPDTGDDL